MTEHIRIDREYGFIDVWGFNRSQLEALNLPAIVIGVGCKGQLTVIPDQGANVEVIANTLQALEQPSTQPTAPKQVTPSTVVLPVIDSSHARKGTTATVFTSENTVADDVKRLENTIKARAAKTDKDYQRLQAQRSQVRLLLAENPLMSVSSLAQRMGVSRPTARKLLNLRGLDDNDTIVLGSGTLKSATNETGAQSVQSTPCALAAQSSDATVTVADNYTFPMCNGQPV